MTHSVVNLTQSPASVSKTEPIAASFYTICMFAAAILVLPCRNACWGAAVLSCVSVLEELAGGDSCPPRIRFHPASHTGHTSQWSTWPVLPLFFFQLWKLLLQLNGIMSNLSCMGALRYAWALTDFVAVEHCWGRHTTFQSASGRVKFVLRREISDGEQCKIPSGDEWQWPPEQYLHCDKWVFWGNGGCAR